MTSHSPGASQIDRVLRAAVVGAVVLRVWLDLLWWVPTPVPKVGLIELVSGAASIAFVAVALRQPLRVRQHPLALPGALLAVACCIGVVRAQSLFRGLEGAFRTLSPLLLALAVSLSIQGRERWVPRGLLLSALVPLGWSLYSWASGAPGQELHGIERLVGGYKNLHNHALVMAFFAALGAFWASTGERSKLERAGAAIVGLLALFCLHKTYVRTGLVFVGVVGGTYLVLERRFRALAVLGAGVLMAFMASASLRMRFFDLVAPFVSEVDDWERLGSSRPRVWRLSVEGFTGLGTVAMILGAGFYGYETFWKGLDPHNEFLSLWFQVGVLGVVAWTWAMVGSAATLKLRAAGAGEAWRRELAHFAVASIVGALVTCAISNAFFTRITIAWCLWAVVGAALSAVRPPSQGSPGG